VEGEDGSSHLTEGREARPWEHEHDVSGLVERLGLEAREGFTVALARVRTFLGDANVDSLIHGEPPGEGAEERNGSYFVSATCEDR
jgi:hypothetical protein